MGGGSSANPCTKSGGGSVNPSNKPTPPRTGGKYVTKSIAPLYGPPTRDTGCGNAGVKYGCVGGEYKWDNKSCPCAGSAGSICVKDLPFADMCPTIGALSQTDWDGKNVKCQYNTCTLPFDQLSGYFDDTNANKIKGDRCNPLGYAALAASSECRTYYGANLDSELMKRIEATGNGWASDAVLRTAVNGYVAAELISNPPRPSDISARGKTLIRNFCTANPNDPKCGCYNAIAKGLTGCQASPTSPGCSELAALGTQFDNAPPEFKPIFQNMKNQVNAMCLSENCKTVRGSSGNAAGILLPGTVPSGDCSSTFNVCLTKLTVGQMTGGNIDSSCKQEFNLPSPTPTAAPTPAPSGVAITSGPSGTQGSVAGGTGPATSTTTGGNPPTPAASDLLFKDPTGYLDSKEKQYGVIAAFLICCCLIILLLFSGGDSPDPMQQALQMKLMGL